MSRFLFIGSAWGDFGSARILTLVVLFLQFGFALITPAAPPAGYYLVWADEFNTNAIDTSQWTRVTGPRRDAVNATNTVSLNGSNMVITTYTANSTHYTAYVNTSGKFLVRYGYLESRINYNDSPGEWSAFWMQSPTMGKYIDEPELSGLEIDICEHRLVDGGGANLDGKVQHTFHWDGYGTNHQSAGKLTADLALGGSYHTYGFQWTPTGYNFFIDGANTWTPAASVPISAHSTYILLSSEVENASWAGNIPAAGYGTLSNSTTRMEIDYVRYYAPTSMVFWDGSASADWTNASNWNSARAPQGGFDVVFSYLAKANPATVAGANYNVRSLTFLETPSAITISSNTLTIGAGGIDLLSASATARINADLVLGAAQTWNVAEGRKLIVSGSVGGSAALTLAGRGASALAGSNTYSGTVRIAQGALEISNVYALQNATVDLNASDTGTLYLRGLDAVLGGLKGERSLALGAGEVAIGNNNQSTTYGGVLSGTGGLIKVGSGTLTLTNTLPVSGPTTIRAGKLVLANRAALAAPATVAVNPGAQLLASGLSNGPLAVSVLTGGGTLVGPLAVTGTLAPGTATNALATLTVSNALNLAGTFEVDLAAPGQSDRLLVRGGAAATVILAGPLHLNAAPGILAGTSFTLIDNDGAEPVQGRFTDRPPATTFAESGYTWEISYTGGDGNDVVLTAVASVTLVSPGSVWRYFDQTNDLGTAWRSAGYPEAGWAAGPAQLGFGDGDEATLIRSNRQITTYFRRSFLATPGTFSNLTLRLLRDDGGVVYLNGVEVFRSNLTNGPVNYLTLASNALAGDETTNFYTRAVSPSLLVPGENLLAVEIHQSIITSSDLSFDLDLRGEDAPNAPLLAVANADGATDVSFTSARLNGAVTVVNASAPAVTIYWGPLDAGTNAAAWPNRIHLGALGYGPFSTVLTNLVPGTSYGYRCYASNALGEAWAAATSAFATPPPVPVTLVHGGSSWRFFDQTNDLGAAWRSNNFNDAAWRSGVARLGFGGDGEVTRVASNRQWTTYFRRPFYVPNPALVPALTARLTRDDGAGIYLNGAEIWHDTNLPAGLITNQTPALSALGGTNETGWISLNLPPGSPGLLVAGWNLLAAEVHQSSLASTDLGFDLELAGTLFLAQPPLLQASLTANRLALSAASDATYFTLYSATNLAAPVWIRATNEPVLFNSLWYISLPVPTEVMRFYRLQSEP
jgi:autotransporter-associated beta strand protein